VTSKVPRSKQTEVLNTELAFLVLKPPRGVGYLPFVPPAFGCRELLRFARLSRHLSFGGIKKSPQNGDSFSDTSGGIAPNVS